MQQFHSIQFLRFIAAFMVVLHHSADLLEINLNTQFTSWLMYLLTFGDAGVHIFFVISGFVMVYAANNKFGQKGYAPVFLKRRFLRIYPIYWACFALTLLFAPILNNPPLNHTTAEILASTTLLPDYSAKVLPVGWTLSFEIYFYFLFSLAVLLPKRLGISALCLFMILSIAVGRVVKPENSNLQFISNPILIEFVAGVIIAIITIERPHLVKRFSNILIALGLTGFILAVYIGKHHVPTTLLFGIPSALLIMGLAAQEVNQKTPAYIQRYSWLGDSSYSLYLTHVMVVFISVALLRDTEIILSNIAIFVISLLCVLFGIGFYKAIEKPLMLWAKRV